MTGGAVPGSAVLLGLAAALLVHRPGTHARLARAMPHRPPQPARARPDRGPQLACALAGLAVALLVAAPAGRVLGLAVGVGGPRVLRRLEPRLARQDAAQLARELPLALDLLAACLSGGAALATSVRAVAEATPGPCGRRFGQVAAALAVGSTPVEAWSALAAGSQVGASAARALARAGEGGAPVAAAVSRIAADARLQAAGRATEAARRAGVLAVGPLGLCFLPAFVLLGVVPAVVGLATPLIHSI